MFDVGSERVKVSIQCNHIFEIIRTTNHNLLGHLRYTPCLLSYSIPHCLMEKLWGLYEPSAVTLRISVDTHIPYRCYKKCNWKHRWNFQMHQIYTGKQFTSDKFLSHRYHARQRTCAEEKLDKISARLKFPWKPYRDFAQKTTGISRFKFLKKKFYKKMQNFYGQARNICITNSTSSIYCNLNCICNLFGYMLVDSNSSP
jgi:hypothetical protein